MRIQAANFIQDAVWKSDLPEIDHIAFQQVLLECTARSYYELGAENEAYKEAHMFSIVAFEYYLSNIVTVNPQIADFFISAMHDESLTYRFRHTAAYTASQLNVTLLEGQDTERMQELLTIAINTSMYLASEELENKTFETLYDLIWAIAVTANDDFPLIKDGSADTGGDQRGSITRGRLHWLIPHRCTKQG